MSRYWYFYLYQTFHADRTVSHGVAKFSRNLLSKAYRERTSHANEEPRLPREAITAAIWAIPINRSVRLRPAEPKRSRRSARLPGGEKPGEFTTSFLVSITRRPLSRDCTPGARLACKRAILRPRPRAAGTIVENLRSAKHTDFPRAVTAVTVIPKFWKLRLATFAKRADEGFGPSSRANFMSIVTAFGDAIYLPLATTRDSCDSMRVSPHHVRSVLSYLNYFYSAVYVIFLSRFFWYAPILRQA